MMREVPGVTQEESKEQRRWFRDEYFDLLIWQSDAQEVISFQICYGADASARALEWRKGVGFYLDGAKPRMPAPGSAVGARAMQADAPSIEAVTGRFAIAARALPEDIRLHVTTRLREYVEQAPATLTRRREVRRPDWKPAGPDTPDDVTATSPHK